MTRIKILVYSIALLLLITPQHVFGSNSNLLFKILGNTQCVDDLDNDLDGFVDYPADGDCDSYEDDDEFTPISTPFNLSGGGGTSGARDFLVNSTRVFISGSAFPGGLIKIVKDGFFVQETIAGADGSFDIRLSDLDSGPAIFVISAEDAVGRQALPVAFTIFLTEGVITQIGSINFNAIDPTATVTKCPPFADLNDDCKVNIFDFSIAAFWWNKPLTGNFFEVEKNKLNNDGKVSIEDFSIMAFYWTG